ncbi:MAG: hypothetical protein AUI11_06475 [Acidobacteria bacterium 13_2_20CM_2_66_4]|nr:MAG: hypothetical protein AUI11_06475 [Acidobacteria bacterium 13_2_20CM_2_66_4]
MRNVQRVGSAFNALACCFSTRGVSVAGSKLTVTRRTLFAASSSRDVCSVAKCRSMSGQNVASGHFV